MPSKEEEGLSASACGDVQGASRGGGWGRVDCRAELNSMTQNGPTCEPFDGRAQNPPGTVGSARHGATRRGLAACEPIQNNEQLLDLFFS